MGLWAWVDGVVGAFLRPDAVVPDQALNRPRSPRDQATIARRSWLFVRLNPPFDELQLDERSRFTDPVRRDHDSSPPPAVRS